MFENNENLFELEKQGIEYLFQIIKDPVGERSPLFFKNLEKNGLKKVPILNQILYLLNYINEAGEIPLTKTGNLKTDLVDELYNQGFLYDYEIEEGITKLYGQESSLTINLTKILLDISDLTKKRHNKYSLTKRGQELLDKPNQLLQYIFHLFGETFNMAYFDGYSDDGIGNVGYGFTLLLLNKFGNEYRKAFFYAEEYLNVVPQFLNKPFDSLLEDRNLSKRAYVLRTFHRFLNFFGIIEIENKEIIRPSESKIKTTPLFNKFIGFVVNHN
ncbi:MAG TPA: hypothetical protein VKP78_08420 [bacterium]|nr:hypothetical protein [bacterium]